MLLSDEVCPSVRILHLGAARALLKSSQDSALLLSIQGCRQVGFVLRHPRAMARGGQAPFLLQGGVLCASGQLCAGLSVLSNMMLAEDRHGIA